MTDRPPTNLSETRDDQAVMRATISEIRREGYKVAVIYGVIDATLVDF